MTNTPLLLNLRRVKGNLELQAKQLEQQIGIISDMILAAERPLREGDNDTRTTPNNGFEKVIKEAEEAQARNSIWRAEEREDSELLAVKQALQEYVGDNAKVGFVGHSERGYTIEFEWYNHNELPSSEELIRFLDWFQSDYHRRKSSVDRETSKAE